MNHHTQNRKDAGIECPACGCRHFYTTHTEPLRDGRIRRRKICRNCGRKMTTFETNIATSSTTSEISSRE